MCDELFVSQCDFYSLRFPGEPNGPAQCRRSLRNKRLARRAPLLVLRGLRAGLARFESRWGRRYELQMLRVMDGSCRRILRLFGRMLLRLALTVSRRMLVRVSGRLRAAGPRGWVVMVVRMMVVILMRISQLTVLADQILNLSLQLVDPLPLGLNQTLLVLYNSGQFFEIKHGFHWVIQQALHYYNLKAFKPAVSG